MGLPPGMYFEGSVTADAAGECMTTRLGRLGSRRCGSGDRCRQLLVAETALHATTAAVCTSSWDYHHRNDAWVHHVLVFPERVPSDSIDSLARVGLDGRRWTRLPGHMLQGVKRAARSVGLFRDQLANKLSGCKLGTCALVLEQESDTLLEHDEEAFGEDVPFSRLRTVVDAQRSSRSVPVQPANIPDAAATADRSLAAGLQSTTNFAASVATTVDLLDIDDLDSEEMEEVAEDRCLALASVYTSPADVSGCCSAVSAATPWAASPTCTTISSLPRSSFSFAPFAVATGQAEERRARSGSDERASGWMARSLKTEVSRCIGACSGSAAGADGSIPVQGAVPGGSDGLPAWRLAFGSARAITPLSLNETEGPRVVEEAGCVAAAAGAGASTLDGADSSPFAWAPLMPQWRGPVHEVELLAGDCDAAGGHEQAKLQYGELELESMELEGVVHIELSPAK